MLFSTQPHKDFEGDDYTIKIGNTIPKDAVGLAYFKNRTSNNDEGVLISEAPKLTIDHMTAEYTMFKYCVPNKDPKYFPIYYYYSDNNGYSGELPIESTEWIEHVHFDEADHTEVREYIVTDKTIPKNTINVSIGHLSGVIGATSVKFEPLEYKDVTKTTTLKKKVFKTVRQNDKTSADFSKLPATQSYDKDGYKCTMNIIESSKRAIPIIKDSTAFVDTITKTENKDYIEHNGKKYYKLKTTKKLEKKKAFGTMRYWGPQRNGICGS